MVSLSERKGVNLAERYRALSSVIGKYVQECLAPLQAAIDTLNSQIAGKADAAQLLNVKNELKSRIVAMGINARTTQ